MNEKKKTEMDNNIDVKTYNLNVRRPQVLLLGNGLTYANGIPWHQLIEKVARVGANVNKYKKHNKKGKFNGFYVPNTVLTMATSEIQDKIRHEKYRDVFKNVKYTPDKNIKRLLEMPFDAILTTNYTYELETVYDEKYPSLSAETKRKKYSYRKGNVLGEKYLLHTYNCMAKNKPEIWHIHGELRCPRSMILSHDEYARLVRKIVEFSTRRGGDYGKDKEKLEMKSWIDYFLMGDVYVLGLSFDYSDFDLWWLLGRRQRESTGHGKFIFYEPEMKEKTYKQLALCDIDATVKNCGVLINGRTGDATYARFYKRAIDDIENEINK